MATTAPYRPGDRINLLRDEKGRGTVWGPLPVDRVVASSDGRTWRVECTRLDGTAVHVVVDRTGRDVNDYAAPVRS